MSWKQAFWASPGPKNFKEAGLLFSKGALMGAADLIPGVSGGTIAFVTGIYESFLEAISSVNKNLVQNILRGEFKTALAGLHVRFLAIIFGAILLTIFTLARLMHYLMTEHTVLTWSLFFGLISASIIVVFRQLKNPFKARNLFFIGVGAIFAYICVSLIPVQTPEANWFIFLCGMISISAMILPGLSGSFLLLILGKYEYVTAAVKNPFADGQFGILLTFFLGAVTGAIGFSRILNWFLKHYRAETMAFLTGILIGSMKKVWPWKMTVESIMVRGEERILREANLMPNLNFDTGTAIGLMLLGFALVLVLEFLSRQRQ